MYSNSNVNGFYNPSYSSKIGYPLCVPYTNKTDDKFYELEKRVKELEKIVSILKKEHDDALKEVEGANFYFPKPSAPPLKEKEEGEPSEPGEGN
jgi:hypothetical protein